MTAKVNKQCKACPWKVSTVPGQDIPGGYCPQKHADLAATIADTNRPFSTLGRSLRVMACHETPPGAERACVGWLHHQLGIGNNIGLRIMALDGRFGDLVLDGEQHESFADTLPRSERKETP